MHKTEKSDLNIIFPTPGNRAGLTWVKTLRPPNRASRKVNINVFIEEQATDPSWHVHPCEQMLIAMDGTGYYQEKDKSIQSLGHGDVIFIQAGVEHWHAASLGCAFSHVVINANQCKQIITWLKRVQH